MKRKSVFITFLLSFVISFLGVWCSYYFLSIKAVSSKSKVIEFSVKNGSNYYTIAKDLENKKLINSALSYKIYIKLNTPTDIKAGIYKLNQNMSVKEIVAALSKGAAADLNSSKITFKEGCNMRCVIKNITDNTNNKEEDVINTLNDKNYLNGLIEKYWFIDNSILNSNIYYSLEGYLYPETYSINKDMKVQDIFNTMIEQTNKVLSGYKDQIVASKYTPHEILTLASIVELEGNSNSDREGIAGVFYNRLNNGYSLGSDVTAYYGAKVELNERELTSKELNDSNAYNTRNKGCKIKLPIGPICNPGIASIKAAINPKIENYYYFVADKNGKTYFAKTDKENIDKKNELKKAGLWHEYN